MAMYVECVMLNCTLQRVPDSPIEVEIAIAAAAVVRLRPFIVTLDDPRDLDLRTLQDFQVVVNRLGVYPYH